MVQGEILEIAKNHPWTYKKLNCEYEPYKLERSFGTNKQSNSYFFLKGCTFSALIKQVSGCVCV